MNCINTNLPQFKALAVESGLHPMVLSAKMGSWMQRYQTDEWPTIEDLRLDMVKDRVDELSTNIETYKALEQTEDVIAKISDAEALKEKIDEYNNRIFSEKNNDKIEISNGIIATKVSNKDYVVQKGSANNVLGFTSKPSFPMTESWKYLKAIKGKNEYNRNNNIPFTYSFHPIENPKTGKVESWNIYARDMAFGQLSLFELSKIITNPTESPSESTDSKTFSATLNKLFDQLVIQPLKVSKIGSKWALRVSYEIAKNLSERTGIIFEVISQKDADNLVGEKIAFGSNGFYIDNYKKAYLIEGKFTAGTAAHEIFGHPFLELIKDNPEYGDLYNNLLAEAKADKLVQAQIEAGYKNASPEVQDKEFITNYITNSINRKVPSNAISAYFKAFTDFLKKLFRVESDVITEIRPDSTLEQITDWLLYDNNKMSLLTDKKKAEVKADLESGIVNQLITDYNYENGVRTKEQSINGITAALESNETIDNNKNKINNADIYFERIEAKPNFLLTSSKFKETKDAIVKNLRAQLKSIERKPNASKTYKDELAKLIKTLAKEESYQAAITFITHSIKEVDKVDKAMSRLMTDMYDNKRLDSAVVEAAKADFIDMYRESAKALRTLTVNKSELSENMSAEEFSQFNRDLKYVEDKLSNIDSKFTEVFKYQYGQVLREIGLSRGDLNIDNIVENELFTIDKDFNLVYTMFGSPAYSNISQLQALNSLIGRLQSKSLQEFTSDPLITKLAELGKKAKTRAKGKLYTSYSSLYEMDENGKATGFLVSPLKYGVFLQNMNAFQANLDKKYNIEEKGGMPDNEDDRQAYLKERNNFLANNAERMFVPEYYALRNSLSEEASEALEDASSEIRKFMNRFTNEETGKLSTEKMTDVDVATLITAKQFKTNLASDLNLDGTYKTGIDLDIAKEIREFNKKLAGKVKYTPNYDLFNAQYKIIKATKTPEEAAKWYSRNVQMQIEESFYEDLAQIEKTEQSAAWQSVYDQRAALLKAYRHVDSMSIMVDRMPYKVKVLIKEMDDFLFENKAKGKKGGAFSKLAEIVTIPEFDKKKNEARSAGAEAYKDFMETNTRLVVWDKTGAQERVPLSIWTRLEPVDKKRIKYIPNSIWSDIDVDSEFYNKNYDEKLSDNGYQPKKSVYDNSSAYNKAMKDDLMKEIYNTVIAINKKSNSMYHYIEKSNPLKIAQKSGGTLRTILAEKNVFKGVLAMFRDAFTKEVDDSQYGSQESDMFRADGSKLRFPPTSFRTMLDNPDKISRNLIGITGAYASKAIQFKNLSEALPDIDILRRGIANTKAEISHGASGLSVLGSKIDTGISSTLTSFGNAIKMKTGRIDDVVEAGQTNLYKKAKDLIDMNVYGIEKQSMLSWKLKSGRILDIAKPLYSMMRFAANSNLSGNIMVIMANYFGAELNMTMDAITGYYISIDSLAKAQLEITKNAGSLARSSMSSRSNNKIISTMRMFNIVSSTQNDLDNMHGNNLVNFVKENIFYGPYSAGDFVVKSKMLIAFLLEHKFYNGQFYHKQDFLREFYPLDRKEGEAHFKSLKETLYDAIETDKLTGAISVADKYKESFTPENIADISIKANRMAARLDGILTDRDKTKMHTTVIGKALTMHRGFLITAIQERLHGRQFNYEHGMETEGQYVAAYGAAKNWIYKLLGSKLYNSADSFQNNSHRRYQIQKTMIEVSTMIMLGFVANVLRSLRDDEDDKDKQKNLEWVYMVFLRLLYEQNAVYSPTDIFGIIKSPTAAQGWFDSFIELLGYTSSFEGLDPVRSGVYKDMTKLEKSLWKLSPAKHLFEFYKGIDLKSKERYMLQNIGKAYDVSDMIIDSEKEIRLRERDERKQKIKERIEQRNK